MRQQDLGMVTAYAYAVSQGYTGTEEEFAALMASYATVAEEAAESATEAAASATAAGTSETNAAASATSAAGSATSAGNSATSASGSAVQAQASATAAGQSATQAAGSATAAGQSATAAAGSATQAAASETAAGASATAAAGSATSASGSATAAAGSATDADASADRAQEILNSIPADYTELTEDVSDLKSAIGAEFDRITEGVFTPVLEVGSINLSDNTITYPDYKYRVRTAQGTAVRLHAGDVVGLSSYADARFLAFWAVNGTWTSSGWKTSDLTIAADGDYLFLLAKVTEDTSVVYTDPSQIGFTLRITDKNTTASQITTLSDDIDDINDIIITSEIIPNVLTLTGGRIYRYFDRILSGGTLTVTAMPASTRYGLQGFTDPAYTTKTFDSGWQTSVPYTSPTIDTSLYYRILIANYDYSAITDVTVGNALKVVNTYTIQDEVNALRAETHDGLARCEMYQSHTVRSIAHRGDFDTAPQCTAPAYLLAQKNGFAYAENDVNLSQDDEFVMWHDTSLSRLGDLVDINGYLMYTDGTDFYWVNSGSVYTWDGTQYVSSAVPLSSLTRCAGADYSTLTLNLAVLKRIDFGAYKGDQYKGTTILTFAEWVMLCKRLGMELYIDSKITYTEEMVSALATILRRAGMLSKATWVNINTTAVADLVRAQDNTARMCILVNPSAQLITQWTPYNTGRGFFFNGNAKVITQEEVQLGLDNGFEVEAYYVEYVGQTASTILNRIATFIGYGVTGLTLDGYRAEDTIALLS